ncbi:Ms4533A family Cys-rich leader peptide [Streptomyces sp. SID3212]
MSPRRTAIPGHAAIELALIGVTALCVADILCS